MGCNWPCCGPCLFAKISARVAWPKTQFETFGDSPFKQVSGVLCAPLKPHNLCNQTSFRKMLGLLSNVISNSGSESRCC
jgi:hypothetical protein